ncbi:MAG: hypothetical protein Q9169_006100 [Polycauliona sp. 2 TL-2023]
MPRSDMNEKEESTQAFRPSWRVWSIFVVLCLLSFISAVDATIVTTSLPTITKEVGGAELYVWIANSFLFASTVPQPFIGQISNIFGRRSPILFSIALFAFGSGLAGGARNPGMLIGGRTIQGLGTSGLYVLSDIIICDIVPPRHRAPYLSAVLSTAALGTTIGPIIGGALVQVQWRWVFWLNLPIAAAGFLVIYLLLRVQHPRSPTWMHALARVDFLGNAIFIPSLFSIFFGLIMGGTQFPWESWHIVVPLVFGILGWIAFHVHQASPVCKNPSTPPRLFKHRTSAAGFIIIFLGAIILQAIAYFLPIYFQAVKGTSPLLSGVYFLPFALAIIPFGGITGILMSKIGLYIPLHWFGFALNAVGAGMLSTLDQSSSRASWICFQILASGGTGIIFTATLPSTLAALEESDVAVATATYSFVRSFGLVWGVTMASILFNAQVNAHIDSVTDPAIRKSLADGAAYSYASGGSMSALPLDTKAEMIGLYTEALRAVWLLVATVSCLGFCCVFIQRHVPLRESHETDYGLADGNKEDGSIVESGEASLRSMELDRTNVRGHGVALPSTGEDGSSR